MACRPLGSHDYIQARALYKVLSTGASLPSVDAGKQAFHTLIAHHGTTVYGVEAHNQIISMATLHLLPNMTYGARPYGLVENVATLPAFEGRGFGRQVMEGLAQAAWAAGAYKIMLLTGQGNSAVGFYQALGYDADEKQGMILRQN